MIMYIVLKRSDDEMINTNALNSDAIMYAVFDTLCSYPYRVNIGHIPERYVAADLVSDGVMERFRLAEDCIRSIETCTKTTAYEILSITFPEDKLPLITMSNDTSFQLMASIGKKKSWRASRSTSIDKFFQLIGCEDISDAESTQDPLDMVANRLYRMDTPDLSHKIAASLVPTTNFITLSINQNAKMIQSTAFFYSKCGNVDKKVDFPNCLLEVRRKNGTTIRCIYDLNWVFDFRLRRNKGQHRLEWFLKDFPIGVICQTTPINIPVQVRVST